MVAGWNLSALGATWIPGWVSLALRPAIESWSNPCGSVQADDRMDHLRRDCRWALPHVAQARSCQPTPLAQPQPSRPLSSRITSSRLTNISTSSPVQASRLQNAEPPWMVFIYANYQLPRRQRSFGCSRRNAGYWRKILTKKSTKGQGQATSGTTWRGAVRCCDEITGVVFAIKKISRTCCSMPCMAPL